MMITRVCMHGMLLSTYAPPSEKLDHKLKSVSSQVVGGYVGGICVVKLMGGVCHPI